MSLRDDLIEAIATTGGIDERWATRVLDAMLDKLEEHADEWIEEEAKAMRPRKSPMPWQRQNHEQLARLLSVLRECGKAVKL